MTLREAMELGSLLTLLLYICAVTIHFIAYFGLIQQFGIHKNIWFYVFCGTFKSVNGIAIIE